MALSSLVRVRTAAGALLILSMFWGVSVASAATKVFVGPSGGTWENPANWNPAGVPTAGDDVFVTSTNPINVIVSAGQVINFNNLTIATGTLTLNGDIGTGTNITVNQWGSLVQGNGNLQKISGSLILNSITNTPAMTHTAQPLSTLMPAVNFEANTITITTNTLVDVQGLGYAGGALNSNGAGPAAGAGDAAGGGGAASCGNGGNGTGGAGAFNVASPAIFPSTFDYGSGGGGNSTRVGGAGGGKVKLFARGTLTNNGIIKANGVAQLFNDFAGGGAGGSIWLVAKNYIAPSGALAAVGGVGDGTSGGGGGGCILINYFVSSTIGEMNVNPYFLINGGTGGANPGTVGQYRVFKSPAPVNSFAVATGTSPYDSVSLSWNWGGGDFDAFYWIERSLDGMSYTALATTSNTTTLTFTDTGLVPAARYWYRLNVRSSTVPNFVLVSSTAISEPQTQSSFEYADHVILPQPLSATFGALTPTSLPVTLNYGLNPSTTPLLVSDNAGYYYDTNGTRSGMTPGYITVGGWQGPLSLAASTSYVFTFTPYVLVGTNTYYAATSSVTLTTTTPLAAPGAPVFMGESSTTLNMTWATNGNPSSTPYAVYNATLDKYHAANGSMSATPVFFPYGSWNGAVKQLSPATAYNFKIVMRNENGTQNVTTTAVGAITLTADNLPYSTGGTPMGATSSTGSGSGWYYGTPGSVMSSTPASNLPAQPSSSSMMNGANQGSFAPGLSNDLMSAYFNGMLITPQMVFSTLNSGSNGGASSLVTTFLPKNANSNIVFSRLPPSGTYLTIPATLSFGYTYRNPGVGRTIFVERVLIDPSGKVVARSTASRYLGIKQAATYAPSATLGSSLSLSGAYTMRIRVYASNRTTVLDENSFSLLFQKK